MIINEKLGTPDIITNIIESNQSVIYSCISNKKSSIILNINECINIRNKQINFIIPNLQINFNYNSKNYYGNLLFDNLITSNYQKCVINLNIPNNFIFILVLKTLSHELVHLYELHQLKNKFNKSYWNRTLALQNFNYEDIGFFKDLFYLSFPHEIRANIGSIKILLCNVDKDKNTLLKILKGSVEWQNSKNLKEFNPKKFLQFLKINSSIEDILFGFNYFNHLLKIKTKITNEIELLEYLEKVKKYFLKKGTELERKLLSKVSERLNEKLEYITTYFNYDNSYEHYLNSERYKHYSRECKINKILEEDYLEYLQFF